MQIEKLLLQEQKNEITAYHIYGKLAERVDDPHNADVLMKIAADELRHYHELKEVTSRDIKPDRLFIFFFYWVSRIFGLTFGIKLLEKGEDKAQKEYAKLGGRVPILNKILEDEERHEKELINMLNEERLEYMGSVVLGLNDALVELTGALAGYTFAFQNTRLIALTGLITGISASFSMAASEYLSTKHEEEGSENAGKAAIYTGIAYVFTVAALITPYLVLSNPYISLGTTLGVAVLIIFVFNYYISIAKDTDFKRRFIEMTTISLGVAGISFMIGVLVKKVIGIDL